VRVPAILLALACATLLAGCVTTVYENEEDASEAAHGRQDGRRGARYRIDAFDVMEATRSWKRPPR